MIILNHIGDKATLPILDKVAPIKIRFDWTRPGNLLSRLLGRSQIDYDLGCYYELNNGHKLVIDGLQFAGGKGGNYDRSTAQGCYIREPYIWHMGDNQGSQLHSHETILVNPGETDKLRRLIIYAYIYEGRTQWAPTHAQARVIVPGADEIVVNIDEKNTDKRFCAIAAINFDPDSSLTVQKVMSFYTGHSDCDKAYGWGFKYYDKK